MRKVYIIAHDGGYEGFSEPLRAFKSKRLADLYVEAANSYGSGHKVFEMEIFEALEPENQEEDQRVK